MVLNKLNKQSIAKLCSDQVVLDLSSIIKELTENALDAGASHIDVKLGNQGLDFIEVSDNGKGMSSEDLVFAGKKYYTSKLVDFEDLERVNTYGFRGEALSSICSLAKVTISTNSDKSNSKGIHAVLDENGDILEQSIIARQVGTTIKVSNMFHRLPVRQKEMQRNIKKEYNKLVHTLQALALVQTGVKISLSQSSTSKGGLKTLFKTPGNGSSIDHITSVLGNQLVQLISPFNLDLNLENGKFSIGGHISKPSAGCGRSTGTLQFISIQSRPCTIPKIQKVINEIYKSINPHQYPFIVANISCSSNLFDVNVTPDKRTIFLHNENIILDEIKNKLPYILNELNSAMYINETAVKVEAEAKLMLKQRLLSEVSDLSTKAQKIHNSDSAISCNVSSSNVNIPRASASNTPLDSNILQSARSTSNVSIPKVIEQKAAQVQPESINDSRIIVLNSKASNNKQSNNNYPKPVTNDFQIRDMNNTDSVFQNPTPLKQTKLTVSHKNNIPPTTHANDTPQIAHINTMPLTAQKKNTSPTARIATLSLTDHHSASTSPTKILKNQDNQINDSIVKKPVLEWDYSEFEEEACSSEYELNQIDERLGTDLKTGNNTIEDNLQHSLTVQKSDFENMKIIGQFNHGFIIVQLGNHLFIVDQHASDEKYTFETLQSTTKFKPQPLIRPKLIHLPIHDEIIAIDQKEHLEANGFHFIVDNNSSSGNRIRLTSFPVSKGIIFDESDFLDLIHRLSHHPHPNVRCQKVYDILASRACRAAVMIGDALDYYSMTKIVKNMGQIQFPWNCPHGRPTIRHLYRLGH